MSHGQELWYHMQGLVARNTHVPYSQGSGLKDMAKVKVFQK